MSNIKRASVITIDFGDRELEVLHPQEFHQILNGFDTALLKIPIPYCHTMIDVAYSYLNASYILECLANEFETSQLTTSSARLDDFNYNIEITGYTAETLAPLLIEFLCILNNNEYVDEDEAFHYYEKVNEYESDLETRHLKFPDVADNYFANLINGALQEMCLDASDEANLKTEYKYGYWKSAKCFNSEHTVLVSTACWIVPNTLPLQKLLENDDIVKKFSILPANLVVINSQAMVISENSVLQIAMGEVIQGISCIHEVFPEKNGYYPHRLDKLNGSFFSRPRNNFEFNGVEPGNFWQDDSKFELYASEFGEFIVFKTPEASLILFNISKPAYSKSEAFVNAMLTISSSFEDGVLLPPSITLDWSSFDDEKFEQLCYDIIYLNSKFDSTTIRKMGNSRSRDGGRDIVVYTREIHNQKPKKYIFQCKFSKSKKSLNTSNVGSISDVIDQFGAEGYGVFCNTVIDSTLYDRLDGICNNRQIENDTWDINRIDRFVGRRPNINHRYFG